MANLLAKASSSRLARRPLVKIGFDLLDCADSLALELPSPCLGKYRFGNETILDTQSVFHCSAKVLFDPIKASHYNDYNPVGLPGQ